MYTEPSVGAGLLAKAVCQSKMFQLNHRIREQARSHILNRARVRAHFTTRLWSFMHTSKLRKAGLFSVLAIAIGLIVYTVQAPADAADLHHRHGDG